MKNLFILLTILILAYSCENTETKPLSYDDYPVYEGDDLGLTYSPESSTFKLWSPPAEAVRLQFYTESLGGETTRTDSLVKAENGIWEIKINEDLAGQYYTFQVKIDGEWLAEVPDPYAVAVGANGKRAMVVDLEETDPDGWANDRRPAQRNFNEIIVYELHVRDLSMHENSGIQQKGKFLGVVEKGTTGPNGVPTGLDHILDLGVTHIHFLPSFDYLSVDETKLDEPQFNWGYDPQNYNVPEGSYSTDPYDGRVRIREFKQMVKTLHDNGIRVVMDVVYNHTGITEGSNFNQLVPGYYYRQNEDGTFSDASACGNEVASERPMVRKFMIESVKHWVNEYHVDGFRFDLMGIHDIETMNQISEELHAIDPTIFIYGEGWTAGSSPLPEEQQALKKNTTELNQIAAFSDDIRDGLKGSVFEHEEKGFVSGAPDRDEDIKFGIVASVKHPQVQYDSVSYSEAPWAPEPFQTMTYVSCHDNHTLYDRLKISNPEATEDDIIKMHKLAGGIVLTSQGVAFLHAGVELLRTKFGEENSYNKLDSINRLDWARKTEYTDVYEWYKNMIALRKNHPAFRMTSAGQIREHLQFMDLEEPNLIGYTISGNANGDSWENIVVLLNGNAEAQEVSISQGNWKVAVDGKRVDEAGVFSFQGDAVTVPERSMLVLFQ